nr:hypothetical protein [Tanacetum cinerariifolium]
MDNKKHIVNLESFREMLHIFLRLPHQPFVEPPFEEEILVFLCFLGYSEAIRKLTNVEHKDKKKSNEMYYPRFTKVIIYHFMSKDPSILRKNKVNWHYVRDDHMFSTIKLVSRHQNTQQFGALLPIELTNEDIRNSNAYKEYYAVATGATPPKPKASVRKTRSSADTTITPPTAAAGPRLTTSEKGKQAAKASKAKSLSPLSEVSMTEAQQLKLATKISLQQTHISQASGSGADEGTGDDDEGKDGDDDDDDNGDDGEEGDGDDDENDDGEEGNDDDDDQEDVGDDEDDEEKGGDDEQASDEEEFIHPSLSTHTEEEPRDEESSLEMAERIIGSQSVKGTKAPPSNMPQTVYRNHRNPNSGPKLEWRCLMGLFVSCLATYSSPVQEKVKYGKKKVKGNTSKVACRREGERGNSSHLVIESVTIPLGLPLS